MVTQYEMRESEFGDGYAGSESFEIEDLIGRAGEYLALVTLDEDATDQAMKALYDALSGTHKGSSFDGSWRDLWSVENADLGMEPKSAQFFVALHAFAYYGLAADTNFFRIAIEDKDTVIRHRAFVATARKIHDAIPAAWGGAPYEIGQSVLAAECRFSLDTGAGVTVEQLASLARVGTKSIKNMLTPGAQKSYGIKLGEDDLIPATDALRWLESRGDFKTSLWRDPDAPSASRDKVHRDLGPVVFVPVANDNSSFDPVTCRRGLGYTIGAKGAEETLADFDEALARLQRMEVPKWRRPNAEGNWGLVKAVRWERRTARDTQSSNEGGGQ
jgi:hypothetical protein